jgi:hypothetical protein
MIFAASGNASFSAARWSAEEHWPAEPQWPISPAIGPSPATLATGQAGLRPAVHFSILPPFFDAFPTASARRADRARIVARSLGGRSGGWLATRL